MPKITASAPKYRRHRASGQAVVTIAGRDLYLGPHGTATSRTEYDRVIGEWIAAGRPKQWSGTTDITVVEVAAAFMNHARDYYRKNGVPGWTCLTMLSGKWPAVTRQSLRYVNCGTPCRN